MSNNKENLLKLHAAEMQQVDQMITGAGQQLARVFGAHMQGWKRLIEYKNMELTLFRELELALRNGDSDDTLVKRILDDLTSLRAEVKAANEALAAAANT